MPVDDNTKIAIITYGNPSRGDDAIGPLMFERLQKAQALGEIPSKISLVTDFQLQIEHILDFSTADCVIFVDAALNETGQFAFRPITPRADQTFSTHALSPQALLMVYESVLGESPPPAWLLAIQGFDFELGGEISTKAAKNLDLAEVFLKRKISGENSFHCRENGGVSEKRDEFC